jgi:hypothetical protein
MMFTTRFWGGTAVLLCALLLQSCQPHPVSIIDTDEEKEPAAGPSSASAMRQRASSEPLTVQPLTSPSAALAAYVPSSRLSTTLANEEAFSTARSPRSLNLSEPSTLATMSNSSTAPYNLPAAVMPRASHAVSSGKKLGHAPSPVFTTASGEHVRFGQVDGQWRAAIQARYEESAALQRTLPVVSSEDIGALLSRLQHQDVWASRSRIHVVARPTPPYSSCVYLGKMGLLGGSSSDRVVEWRPGPHIRLSTSNDARTEVYHIPLPAGHRYWGYREHPGSMVQRASCTLRYVEANSQEEITRLEQYTDEELLEAHLSAYFSNVVNLGTLGGGGQRAQASGRHGGHSSCFAHAALVVYVSTKRNRLFKKESKVDVQLEIGIEKIHVDPLSLAQPFVVAHTPPSPMADSVPSVPIPISDPTLTRTSIPSMAFGPQEWNRYYGEVGAAPPLPADIDAILRSRCPFWPEKQVKDTHLLVLIPAKVNGRPFTLNLLGKLIKNPRGGGSKTKYRIYRDSIKAQIGKNSPDCSYWLLMTCDVLPESRGGWHEDQEKLVANHASRTGLPYELPKALEAATAILTHYVRNGERLYGDAPWTYTHCQELLDTLEYGGKQYRSTVLIGGFESSGLCVCCLGVRYSVCRIRCDAVAVCRRLC